MFPENYWIQSYSDLWLGHSQGWLMETVYTLLRSDTYYFFFEHVILTINDSLVIIFIIEVHVIPAILIIIEVLTFWNLKLYTMIFSFHDVWASKLNLPWFSHQRNRTPPHGHGAEMTWFRPRIYEIHPPIPENFAGFFPQVFPMFFTASS